MGNKIKYNIKNVHAAKLTVSVVDGVTTYSYATPQPIPGAVSIALDAEGESSPFYADGIVYFRSATNNGYKGNAADGESFAIEDLEIFENVAYIMAYHADPTIPGTIED